MVLYLFATGLLLIGLADWKWRKIWHSVTVSMLGCAILLAEQLPASGVGNAMIGALLAFILFLAIWWGANRWYQQFAFGFGDVMLAAVLGGIGGIYWGGWMLALGMMLAGVAALIGLLFGRFSRLDLLPYGSFLAAGGIIILLLSKQLG